MSNPETPKQTRGEVEVWRLPSVTGKLINPADATRQQQSDAEGIKPLTAAEIEAIEQQAHQEGFERGYGEGQERLQQEVKRFTDLIQSLQKPFENLDEQVEKEFVTLLKIVARQLMRREIKTDPGQIIAVVRESIAALPVATGNVRVHLHPEDAELARSVFSVSDSADSWKIIEDPVLAKGDCRIVTESSKIDASVEARLTAVVAQLFGGERMNDNA